MPHEIVITIDPAEELTPEAKRAALEIRMERWRRIHVLSQRRNQELDERWNRRLQAVKARSEWWRNRLQSAKEHRPLSRRLAASLATPNGA